MSDKSIDETFDQLGEKTFASFRNRHPAIGGGGVASPGDRNSPFELLGLDYSRIDQLNESQVARELEGIERLRDQRPPLGSGARPYAEFKARFMAAKPGSNYLASARSKIFPPFPHKPGPHSPQSIWTNSEVAQPVVTASGSGLGWSDSDSQTESIIIAWNFPFVPPVTANYKFTALMWFSGRYILNSNDQWWNSKQVHAAVYCGIAASQPSASSAGLFENSVSGWFTSSYTDFTVFEINNDNIQQSSTIQAGEVPIYQTQNCDGVLTAGVASIVQCFAILDVYAQGAGAFAELDFSGEGAGIGCPFVRWDID